MNKFVDFIGPFKDIIPKYVEYKRSLGFKYDINYVKSLRRMDNFFAKNYHIEKISLTKDMVLHFVKKRDNEATSTTCLRCSLIRGFATFLRDLKYDDIYILPNVYIPKRSTSFIPYIFSKEKIHSLFDIIDNYHFNTTYLNNHKIYSTLIRLLYGCGLRISEALSLKIGDLDFTNNIIHIIASKNNSSRIVCMSNSLSFCIKTYIYENHFSKDDWLFPSPLGRSLFKRCYS